MPDRGNYSQLVEPFLTYPGVLSRKHPEGKSYRVPMPDIPTGMRLTSLGEVAQLTSGGVEVSDADMEKLGLNDLGKDDVQRMTLGDAYDEMIADGVYWPEFRRVFVDAFAYFSVSPQVADSIRDALAGEAEAPGDEAQKTKPSSQRTQRTKAGSKSSRASSGTRGRTQSRTSGSSSTSPRGGSGERAAAASA